MTTLPLKLAVGGFDLRQIKRDGRAAVYEQSQRGVVVAYEVVVVKVHPAATIMGREYQEREGYPSNEDWGLLAWTCLDRARAMERFYALVADTGAAGE